VNIEAQDLTKAAQAAAALAESIGQPLVLAGALAMAYHGYRRETSDVDIVIPGVIGEPSGDRVEDAARELGMTVRAKHGFGGLDLRDGEVRIDVLTLDRTISGLVPDAVAEAMASNRRARVFGQDARVVSLGHLIAMKLVAERKKDIVDVIELIKAQIEAGTWSKNGTQAIDVVRRHLGWHGARAVEQHAKTARDELAE
jgi:hypothetical protein